MEPNRDINIDTKTMQLEIIRPFAEITFAHELLALQKFDQNEKPNVWKLSPKAIMLYMLGTKLPDGTSISPKYFGDKKILELSIATLLSDRALLLTGLPGTAKTWVAEHLTAAICGNSSLLIQGTTGIHEDHLRYGWNYASLIANGPSEEALIPSPIMSAMRTGQIVRIEELSRIPTETQDALITILSEKVLPVIELNKQVQAVKGFNLIATANDQDKGIYEMSSALKRRFNIIVMPLPSSLEEEVRIVDFRVKQMEQLLEVSLPKIKEKQMEQLVTIFRELRVGKTNDGKQKLKSTEANLSPAEAISILHHARIHGHYFNHNLIPIELIVPGIINIIQQSENKDYSCLEEYNELVIKKRLDWKEWYLAFKNVL